MDLSARTRVSRSSLRSIRANETEPTSRPTVSLSKCLIVRTGERISRRRKPVKSTLFQRILAGLIRGLDGPWRIAGALAAASAVAWWDVITSPTSKSIGVGGRDFHFYIWSLDVIARGRFAWGPALRTTVIYPIEHGVSLAADGTILAFGFLLAPITRLFGPEVSLNIVMFSAIPLNAAAAFWLYRQVLKSTGVGAILGSVFFSASPYAMGHALGHANLVHLWWFPLALGLIVPAVVESPTTDGLSPRRAYAGGALLGLGMWIGSELVAILAVVLVPWLIGMAIRHRVRIRVFRLFGAGLCAAIVSVPIIWGTVGDANHYTGAHQPPNVFVTDLENFAIPTTDSLVGSTFGTASVADQWTGNAAETTGYISIFGIALLILSLRRSAGSRSRSYAALSLWSMAFSLGPYLHVAGRVTNIPVPPGFVLSNLPLLRSILPGRISFVVAAAVGAVIALSFDQQHGSPRPKGPVRPRRVITTCAVATALATLPTAAPASFDVGNTFGTAALRKQWCGSSNGSSRAVGVPRHSSSFDALTWQARGKYEVTLVRARYFARDYPLHGRVLSIDKYIGDFGGAREIQKAAIPPTPAQVVAELRSLGANCVVSSNTILNPEDRSKLDAVFGRSRANDGLDYWIVPANSSVQ